jgi:uncharacterized membrane protein
MKTFWGLFVWYLLFQLCALSGQRGSLFGLFFAIGVSFYLVVIAGGKKVSEPDNES